MHASFNLIIKKILNAFLCTFCLILYGCQPFSELTPTEKKLLDHSFNNIQNACNTMGTVRYPNYLYNNDYIDQINKENELRRLQEKIEEVERKQAMQNMYQIHSSTWPSL